MKAILILFVLLVPSVAWCAQDGRWPDEPCTNGDLFIDTVSKSYVGCEHEHWHLLRPACEIVMEAAMKAMDEFTPKREEPRPPDIGNTLRYIWPCVSDDCLKAERLAEAENDFAKARAELDRVKRREDSITQWDATKRACWRQP